MGQTRWDSKLFWPNQRDDFKRNKIKVGLDKILTRDFVQRAKGFKISIFQRQHCVYKIYQEKHAHVYV